MILKFFLNVSKDEQKRRFLERLDRPEKNWKFSPADLAERGYWDRYMEAYEDACPPPAPSGPRGTCSRRTTSGSPGPSSPTSSPPRSGRWT